MKTSLSIPKQLHVRKRMRITPPNSVEYSNCIVTKRSNVLLQEEESSNTLSHSKSNASLRETKDWSGESNISIRPDSNCNEIELLLQRFDAEYRESEEQHSSTDLTLHYCLEYRWNNYINTLAEIAFESVSNLNLMFDLSYKWLRDDRLYLKLIHRIAQTIASETKKFTFERLEEFRRGSNWRLDSNSRIWLALYFEHFRTRYSGSFCRCQMRELVLHLLQCSRSKFESSSFDWPNFDLNLSRYVRRQRLSLTDWLTEPKPRSRFPRCELRSLLHFAARLARFTWKHALTKLPETLQQLKVLKIHLKDELLVVGDEVLVAYFRCAPDFTGNRIETLFVDSNLEFELDCVLIRHLTLFELAIILMTTPTRDKMKVDAFGELFCIMIEFKGEASQPGAQPLSSMTTWLLHVFLGDDEELFELFTYLLHLGDSCPTYHLLHSLFAEFLAQISHDARVLLKMLKDEVECGTQLLTFLVGYLKLPVFSSKDQLALEIPFFEAIRIVLNELRIMIERERLRGEFPYNPTALLRLLTKVC